MVFLLGREIDSLGLPDGKCVYGKTFTNRKVNNVGRHKIKYTQIQTLEAIRMNFFTRW